MTTSFSKLLIHHLHKWWSVFFCLCFYILIFLHVGAAVVVNDLQSQFLGLDYRSSNVILNRKILRVKEIKKVNLHQYWLMTVILILICAVFDLKCCVNNPTWQSVLDGCWWWAVAKSADCHMPRLPTRTETHHAVSVGWNL